MIGAMSWLNVTCCAAAEAARSAVIKTSRMRESPYYIQVTQIGPGKWGRSPTSWRPKLAPRLLHLNTGSLRRHPANRNSSRLHSRVDPRRNRDVDLVKPHQSWSQPAKSDRSILAADTHSR